MFFFIYRDKFKFVLNILSFFIIACTYINFMYIYVRKIKDITSVVYISSFFFQGSNIFTTKTVGD